MTRVSAFVVAAACLAASAAAASGCKSDEPKEAIHLGPALPTPPSPAASASTADNAEPTPAFTSFFADRDAGARPTEIAAAPSASAAPKAVVDSDAATIAALRSRADTCFPLAGVQRGTTRTITMSFVVLATGRVSRSDISGADIHDGAFYSCLETITNGASFPEKPDAGTNTRTIDVIASATAS